VTQFVKKIFNKVLRDLKKEGAAPPTASTETADASSMCSGHPRGVARASSRPAGGL